MSLAVSISRDIIGNLGARGFSGLSLRISLLPIVPLHNCSNTCTTPSNESSSPQFFELKMMRYL